MNQLYAQLANSVLDIVVAIIGAVFSILVIPWVKNTVIPWLKEKRLYTICSRFVKGVEKMAESGTIEKSAKKQFVIDLLNKKGITVTPEIDAYIESAVKELDNVIVSGVGGVVGEFEKADTDTSAE